MTCYENSENDKNGNGDDENKQESKNPEDYERNVGPGTARSTEEPQGTPLTQLHISSVFTTGITNEWAMIMLNITRQPRGSRDRFEHGQNLKSME